MPYKMQFYYKGLDNDEHVDVDVYQIAVVGSLVPTAACYVTSDSSDEDAPKKGTWLAISCSSLKPA